MEEILNQIEVIESMNIDTRSECFLQLQQVKKLKKLIQEKLNGLNSSNQEKRDQISGNLLTSV